MNKPWLECGIRFNYPGKHLVQGYFLRGRNKIRGPFADVPFQPEIIEGSLRGIPHLPQTIVSQDLLPGKVKTESDGPTIRNKIEEKLWEGVGSNENFWIKPTSCGAS